MIMPVFQGMIIFQVPPSILITAMSASTFMFLLYIGFSEIIGRHLQYSKFWNVNSNNKPNHLHIKLSSRTGMLILYTPAFLAGIASFFIFPDGGLRFMMVKSALTFHFLKRDLEVLFVHKYSAGMVLDSVLLISSAYFIAVAGMTYIQHLTLGFPEPSIDLKYLGVMLFLAGVCGNFYHHYLLAKLRERDDKGYKFPKGGLFNLVICPHYLFEILGLLGISFICQTLFSFAVSVGSAFYLMGRSYVTRKWYISKFENFPKNVKALIPYVF
ncbi:hypothetical protein LguiA_016636 [Lonicera macranthoides]